MKIDSSDISFVIQGPVVSVKSEKRYASQDSDTAHREMEEGLTQRAISNIRKYFPKSKVIISTWEGQPANDLDADAIIYSKDPGPNIVHYKRNDEAVYENMNRQIVSTVAGLRKVETPYAVKFRSDNVISSADFLKTYCRYEKFGEEKDRIFEQRVLTSDMWALDFIQGWPTPYFLSDFFHFGLTQDLLKLWDLTLFEDYQFDPKLAGKRQHNQYPWPMFSAEQAFMVRFVSKFKELKFKHKFDISNHNKHESNALIANNFIIMNAPDLTLEVPQRIRHEHELNTNFYSHKRWQMLYQRYCDSDFSFDKSDQFKKSFYTKRTMKLITKSFKVAFRLARCWVLSLFYRPPSRDN